MSGNRSNPPRWPERMLSRFCAEEHLDMLLGDLEELYEHRLGKMSRSKARLHYVKDAFDMLRPFALKRRKSKVKNNHIIMFKNYFKISFRNMLRHKVYAGINITGLSVGICCFLLIFLYVQDELSYDRYHEHADDVYRVVVNDYDGNGAISKVFGYASPMHGAVLGSDYAQVIASVRFNPWNFPIIKFEDKQFEESYFNFVEPSIFEVFSFEFLEGNERALDEPNVVMITESTAEKYFGDSPAFGKSLEVINQGQRQDYKVTAVVKDFPEQSHMRYDFMASWITYESQEDPRGLNDYYGNYNYPTYIRLNPGADITQLKDQMPAMLDQNIPDIQGARASTRIGIDFKKLTQIHLSDSAGSGGKSNAYYVYLFGAIGVLVLLIACINYMNLSTAKYAMRLKEVGVRKVLGARKGHISRQFLVESTFYALIALILGFGLSALALVQVNRFSGKSLSINPVENPVLLGFVVLTALAVGLLSGSYPATFMARFHTLSALRSGRTRVKNRTFFRTGLVVFQFAITIALIFGVTVVDRQLHFIRTQDPGFDRELVVKFWASPSINRNLELFKSELSSNPNVKGASASSRIPTGRLGDALDATLFIAGKEKVLDFRFPFLVVDQDYLDVYNIEVVAGEGFSRAAPPDSLQSFIVNETAIERLGYDSPEEALGQKMDYGWYSGFITGVVNDFHFESLHSAIQPIVLINGRQNKRSMSVKIAGNDITATMDFLEAQFKTYNPDRTFYPYFLDDLYNEQYEGEQRLSEISKVFSIIAIAIACLGLLGLVGFSMEQRSKEISVRKVLGASMTNILLLVNRGYVLIILTAFILATPVAYYFLEEWLATFEYHIRINVSLVLFSGLLAAAIAFITICSQALKVALANPVKFLRNE